ncbi:hypothetical protein GQ42DRAFT_170157 [Ramicandelaber brevisporus]|nr:hypothetical protein GQ42DRAFT_170157 [Ramicandelaber brevisporus]
MAADSDDPDAIRRVSVCESSSSPRSTLVCETDMDMIDIDLSRGSSDFLLREDISDYDSISELHQSVSASVSAANVSNQLESAVNIAKDYSTNSVDSKGLSKLKSWPQRFNECLEEARRSNARLPNSESVNPQLNMLTTTPRGYNRFVRTVGPMATFQDWVLSYLAWEQPWINIWSIIFYIWICLSPAILITLPMVFVLMYTGYSYMSVVWQQQAHQRQQQRQSYKESETTSESESVQIQPMIAPLPARMDVATVRRHLRYTQNTVYKYNLAYSGLVPFLRSIDYAEDPVKSSRWFRCTVRNLAITLTILYVFPTKAVFIAAGVYFLTQRAPWVWAFWDTFDTDVIEEVIWFGWDLLVKALDWDRIVPLLRSEHAPRQLTHDQLPRLVASAVPLTPLGLQCLVWEHQRWWLGTGWSPRLSTRDAGYSSFADVATGSGYSSLAKVTPPAGYCFAPGSQWHIHQQADANLTDSDGWVYMDNKWGNPRPNSTFKAQTRRRMWSRGIIAK